MFHALATKALDQEPSHYYQHTRDYLSGDTGYEQWQFLGLQGIADVVARLSEDDNEAVLAKAVNLMPEMPLVSFCNALENAHPQEVLTQALKTKLEAEVETGENNQLVAMLLRALSGAESETSRQELLLLVLDSPLGKDIEVIAAILGRSWGDLHSQSVLVAFVAHLTEQTEMAFNAIMSDLMMIPGMREKVLAVMRGPNQSKLLAEKLKQFLSVF
jgi:hypothetical protein